MENSCREKYKPSPKKWILASRCTGFRRNSALIPANAGLFHYAGNNPVRYIDPDGRLVTSDDSLTNDMILEDIKLSAGDGFYFDENNVLQIDDSKEPGNNYSKEIRNDLISLIKGEYKDTKVSLHYSETYIIHESGGTGTVQNQGRSKYGDEKGLTFRVAIPSCTTNKNGERTSIFIHEFKGHIMPTITGKSATGNAVKDTMPIINSLGLSVLPFLRTYWVDVNFLIDSHDGALTSVEIDGWIEK